LIIGCDVGGGERIAAAADFGDEAIEFARRMARRALEHQVLEKMGNPRFARRLIGTAHLVPDHMGDDGCAMIGYHHDLKPIVEHEMLGYRRLGLHGLLGQNGHDKQGGQGERHGGFEHHRQVPGKTMAHG
jgi:hypothetical protein